VKVLRFHGRDIVKVGLPDGTQGFYRSTGKCSGQAGTWFPFDGCREDGWFMKMRFWGKDKYDHGPLHRFGTHLLSGVSRILGTMNIPEGREATIEEINIFLDTDNVINKWLAEIQQKVKNSPELQDALNHVGDRLNTYGTRFAS
jgi:hypothetical protein